MGLFGLHIFPLDHIPHGFSVEHFFVISMFICQISMITMVVPFLPLLLCLLFSLLSWGTAFPLLPPPNPPPAPFAPAAFSSLPARCWGCCRLTWLGVQDHQLFVRNPSHQPSTHKLRHIQYACMHMDAYIQYMYVCCLCSEENPNDLGELCQFQGRLES